MRAANEQGMRTSRRRLGLVVSTGFLSVLAVAVASVGIAIAFTVASGNGDARAMAAGAGYLCGAFGAPIAAGAYLIRSRGWQQLRGIRFAAAMSLLIHLSLVPIALAALAM